MWTSSGRPGRDILPRCRCPSDIRLIGRYATSENSRAMNARFQLFGRQEGLPFCLALPSPLSVPSGGIPLSWLRLSGLEIGRRQF
jgi:hypothetical protein